jgi:hypothetical protein
MKAALRFLEFALGSPYSITKVQFASQLLALDETFLMLEHGLGTSVIRTFGIRSQVRTDPGFVTRRQDGMVRTLTLQE